ncbi:hypothetical protein LJC74_01545 [Eubacteriales bacterium OttesenSCG-928-A19]|nr:hypothetical protein [Eubacteriales bacterium OttesenSCG-928-A19]
MRNRMIKRAVCLKARPRTTVTCPHCWTRQRSDRAKCYRCEASFIYLDEMTVGTRRIPCPEPPRLRGCGRQRRAYPA